MARSIQTTRFSRSFLWSGVGLVLFGCGEFGLETECLGSVRNSTPEEHQEGLAFLDALVASEFVVAQEAWPRWRMESAGSPEIAVTAFNRKCGIPREVTLESVVETRAGDGSLLFSSIPETGLIVLPWEPTPVEEEWLLQHVDPPPGYGDRVSEATAHFWFPDQTVALGFRFGTRRVLPGQLDALEADVQLVGL